MTCLNPKQPARGRGEPRLFRGTGAERGRGLRGRGLLFTRLSVFDCGLCCVVLNYRKLLAGVTN